MESATSTTFIKRPCTSSRGEEALCEARNILMNRLFLGNYDERRYVSQLKGYRDVVMISPAETELLVDLEKLRHLLNKYCDAKWIGITTSEFKETASGFCFWVKLSNIPFGRFWFQIKEIKFEQEEIILRLKCIRSVRLQDFEDSVRNNNKKIEGEANKEKNEDSSQNSSVFDSGKNINLLYLHLNDTLQQLQLHLTLKNFVLVLKFIAAITFVMVTTAFTCICYIGDYVLRLIRELTMLIDVFSPILIQIIDCFTKTIGGFFILMALFFKKQTNGEQLLRSEHQSQHEIRLLSIKPPPSSSQTIVPINWRTRNRTLKTQLFPKTESF